MSQMDTPNETLSTNGTISSQQEGTVPLLGTILSLIIAGNLCVLLHIGLFGNKSRMTFFMVNLTLSDVFVGLGNVLPSLIWAMTQEFHGNDFVCKLVKFTMCLSTAGSTYAIVSLSIDRWYAVARPLNRMVITSNYKYKLIGAAWFFAAAVSTPEAVMAKIENIPGLGRQCWINLSSPLHWKIYFIVVAVAVFILPAILIAFFNISMVIHVVMRNRNHRRQATTHQWTLPPNGRPLSSIPLHTRNASEQVQRNNVCSHNQGILSRAKIKTLKLTCLIVIAFVLCWSPYMIWNFISTFGTMEPIDGLIPLLINQLSSLNSAVNPGIYWIVNTGKNCCSNNRRAGYNGPAVSV